MARIEQVIHVRGTDGEVRECALFDSASDIPSPAEAREFGLDGARIYGAALRGSVFAVGTDEQWLYANSGTELAFHDGSGESHLLTTPYFVRPKTDALEFGADGGTVYLEDSLSIVGTHEGILSTNGTLYNCSRDLDFISLVNAGTVKIPIWTVVCGANTSASERSFTLTLTYSFADGSTQDITFTGTQAAAAAHTVRIRCNTGDAHITIYGEDGSVLGEGSGDATAVVADGAYVRATAEYDAYKPWSGVWESVTEDIDEWITLEAYYIYFDPDTLTLDSGEHTDDTAYVYTNMDFTVESGSGWLSCYREGNNVELRCLDNEGSDRTATVTATGVEYPLTAKLTITQKGKNVKPEIWFDDDPSATEKTIEIQASGSGVTVPFGWSELTTHLEIDSDYWGTKADGMLSVVIQGYTYNEYASGARVGSPMISMDEPTDALSHPTRVIYFSSSDDSGSGGNTLRIYVNISE